MLDDDREQSINWYQRRIAGRLSVGLKNNVIVVLEWAKSCVSKYVQAVHVFGVTSFLGSHSGS